MVENKKYQYHVYNEHISLLVSVPIESHAYAEEFAKRVAIDFYDYTEKQVEEVNTEFVTSFFIESVINIKKLNG